MVVTRCGLQRQIKDIWKILFNASLIAAALIIAHIFHFAGFARGMLCGVIVSIFLNLRFTAVSSMRIKSTLVPIFESWIEHNGYVLHRRGHEYRPAISRLLRFDSQNIILIKCNGPTFTVIGPYYILKRAASRMGLT